MKNTILFTLLFVFIFSLSVFAQPSTEYSSTRLDSYATQLKRKTVDLADRTSNDLRRGYSNSRADLDNAFLAAQMDASAGLFQQMIQDNRRAVELRDAAAILSDLSRRAPNSGSNSYLWRDVQNSVNDINRELGGTSGGNTGGGYTPPEKPVIGRAYWRGTVDNTVQLKLKDREMETVTIAGTSYGQGTFSFTSALPAPVRASPSRLSRKRDGEMPASSNNLQVKMTLPPSSRSRMVMAGPRNTNSKYSGAIPTDRSINLHNLKAVLGAAFCF